MTAKLPGMAVMGERHPYGGGQKPEKAFVEVESMIYCINIIYLHSYDSKRISVL